MLNTDIFKERVKSLCKAKGVSQKFVSETTGHGAYFLNDIWLGKRNASVSDLEKIASALATTPAYLTGETDDPAPADNPEELSPEEKELLELYRSVSPENQELFRNIIAKLKG